jgi:hypothetical protein
LQRGQPESLEQDKIELAYKLYDEKMHTIKEICQGLGISQPSLYAYLVQRRQAEAEVEE